MSVDAIGDYRTPTAQVISIPSGTTVTGISGNTITISNSTTASIADGSKIKLVQKWQTILNYFSEILMVHKLLILMNLITLV